MIRNTAIVLLAVCCTTAAHAKTEWQKTLWDMTWTYIPSSKTAILGIPETDNTPVSLRCIGKGKVVFEAPFNEEFMQKQPDGSVRVTVEVDIYRGTELVEVDGQVELIKDESAGDYSVFKATIPSNHPLLKRFEHEFATGFFQDDGDTRPMSERGPGIEDDIYPLKGARKVIKRLVSACK